MKIIRYKQVQVAERELAPTLTQKGYASMDYISVTQEQHKKLCDLFELQYQPIEFEPIKYDGPALVSPVGSEERKAMWDDPDHIYNSPEFRKKISDTVKKQMKDPARLKQMSEQGKQNWKKPNSVFNTPGNSISGCLGTNKRSAGCLSVEVSETPLGSTEG